MAHIQAPSVNESDTHYMENGRGYGGFRRDQYLMPVDGTEQRRLDIMHQLILSARDKSSRLHNAPFTERQDPRTGEAPRVLDLGCGTGMWLVDMAEQYPATEFVGVDLYNMAPSEMFQNVLMRSPVDYEGPWAYGQKSFDLIHLQMALGSVSSWPNLYSKVLSHLKPGGWFEQVEMDWQPKCDDDTLRPGRLTDWWSSYVAPPYAVCGRPITYNPDTGNILHRLGFVDIQHRQYIVPTNAWSSSKSEHRSGTWWNIAMKSGEGFGNGFEALSLAVLTRIQRWKVEHARKLCEEAQVEASRPGVHAYNELHIWWAQAPPTFPHSHGAR